MRAEAKLYEFAPHTAHALRRPVTEVTDDDVEAWAGPKQVT
jgi:hypothetical protein